MLSDARHSGRTASVVSKPFASISGSFCHERELVESLLYSQYCCDETKLELVGA